MKKFIVFISLSSLIIALQTVRNFPVENTKVTESKEKIKAYYAVVDEFSSEKESIDFSELQKKAKEGTLLGRPEDKEKIEAVIGEKLKNTAKELDLSGDNLGILPISEIELSQKVLKVDGKSIFTDAKYPLVLETKGDKENDFNQKDIVKLTNVGDIILGRTVIIKMRELGFSSPFSRVAERLKNADLTFADLEFPFSDSFTPPTEGMSFLAPTKAVKGLLDSGIDIVGLANNHSTNFGTKAFLDSIKTLNDNKIAYVGGGLNEKEAKAYKILETKGKKFAFLSINSITGDIAAGQDSPGDYRIQLDPWGQMDQKEVSEITAIIKKAKKESDFVIPMIHWSAEYTHDPNEEMKELAHDMVDAGADLVVGTHPHWVQGAEVYKGKFIAYSLGNFVFDQEWSRETKEGLIMDGYFYKDKLINISLSPILIEDYHRPRELFSDERKVILDKVWGSSRKIDASFK